MSNESSNSSERPSVLRAVMRRLFGAACLVTGAVWLSSCILFVDETEVVIVERLGRISAVLDQPEDRGLNFKPPWPMGVVRRFDARIQLFDPPGREIFTSDKKNVAVDAYVCWRIADSPSDAPHDQRSAVRFFRSLGGVDVANARLETRVRSTLASRVAQVDLSDLMQVSDPEQPPDAQQGVSIASLSKELLAEMRQKPDDDAPIRDRLGIEIVDVRIKRISFPIGNQQSVFERMKSERQKIADRYRSAGLARNTVIRSQADRQYNEILSKAEAEAERIRGEAEAEALAILNSAHERDPEFYRTVKTLDAYSRILNEKTTLVLSASSSLLKLLVDGVPEIPETREPRPLPSGQSTPVSNTPTQNGVRQTEGKDPEEQSPENASNPESDSTSPDSRGGDE